MLLRNLKGELLEVPIFFAGSIERTSFTEMHEPKGFMTIRIHLKQRGSVPDITWAFHELPVRPMVHLKIPLYDLNDHSLRAWLENKLARLPTNSVVKLLVDGKADAIQTRLLNAQDLRALAPRNMILQVPKFRV